MLSDAGFLQDYPEWYKIEKETGKTIKRLSSVRELDYYLKNPDEYIRRLAVLKLYELKLKDSIPALKEIMDDHLETPMNRSLAAWVIKTVCIKWNIDLFVSGNYLSNYTGKEKYEDICGISIVNPISSFKFSFSSMLSNAGVIYSNQDVRSSEDISFDMALSPGEWFKTYSMDLLMDFKSILLKIPGLIFIILKTVIAAVLIKAPCLLFKTVLKVFSGTRRRKTASYIGRNEFRISYEEKRFNPLTAIRRIVVGFLYIVFFPLRVILKHKKIAVASLLAIYLLLAYAPLGKTLTYKYFGIDIVHIQREAFLSSKEILTYAWAEFKSLTGINEINVNKAASVAAEPEPSEVPESFTKQYKVTANTGLNLRTHPDASADKASDKALAPDTIVVYLGESHGDSEGKLWYYIQTPDGKTGWAYSKWLKEIGGGLSAER